LPARIYAIFGRGMEKRKKEGREEGGKKRLIRLKRQEV
jgi:hypothetical protein